MEKSEVPRPGLRLRNCPRAAFTLLVMVLVVTGIVSLMDRGLISDGLLAVAFLASYVGGSILVFKALKADGAAFRRRNSPEPEISVSSTAPRQRSGDQPGPNFWATGGYDPERMGQFVRGTTADEREYIKDAYGDLDMYESNATD